MEGWEMPDAMQAICGNPSGQKVPNTCIGSGPSRARSTLCVGLLQLIQLVKRIQSRASVHNALPWGSK